MSDKCVACGEVAEGKPLYKKLGSNDCQVEVFTALLEMQLLSLPQEEKFHRYICWDCDEIIAEEYVTFVTNEAKKKALEEKRKQQDEARNIKLKKKLKQAFKKAHDDALKAKGLAPPISKYRKKENEKKEKQIYCSNCLLCKCSFETSKGGYQRFNLQKMTGEDCDVADILKAFGLCGNLSEAEKRKRYVCCQCYNKMRRNYKAMSKGELTASIKPSTTSLNSTQTNGQSGEIFKHRPTAEEHAAEIAKLIPPSLANLYKVVTEEKDSNKTKGYHKSPKGKSKASLKTKIKTPLKSNKGIMGKMKGFKYTHSHSSSDDSSSSSSDVSSGDENNQIFDIAGNDPEWTEGTRKKKSTIKSIIPSKIVKKKPSPIPPFRLKKIQSSLQNSSLKTSTIRTILPKGTNELGLNENDVAAPVSFSSQDSNILDFGICNVCGLGYNSRPKDFWSSLDQCMTSVGGVTIKKALQILETDLADVSEAIRDKGLVCRPCFSRVCKGFRSQILQRVAERKGVNADKLEKSKINVSFLGLPGKKNDEPKTSKKLKGSLASHNDHKENELKKESEKVIKINTSVPCSAKNKADIKSNQDTIKIKTKPNSDAVKNNESFKNKDVNKTDVRDKSSHSNRDSKTSMNKSHLSHSGQSKKDSTITDSTRVVYKFKKRSKSESESGSIKHDLQLINLINKSQHLRYKGKVVLLNSVSVDLADVRGIIPYSTITNKDRIRLELYENLYQFGNFHRNLKNKEKWHRCIICQSEKLSLSKTTRWLEDPVSPPTLMVPLRWAQLSIGKVSSKVNLATDDGKVCKRCHRSIKSNFRTFVSTKVATSHGINSEKVSLDKYKVSFDSIAMNIVADPLVESPAKVTPKKRDDDVDKSQKELNGVLSPATSEVDKTPTHEENENVNNSHEYIQENKGKSFTKNSKDLDSASEPSSSDKNSKNNKLSLPDSENHELNRSIESFHDNVSMDLQLTDSEDESTNKTNDKSSLQKTDAGTSVSPSKHVSQTTENSPLTSDSSSANEKNNASPTKISIKKIELEEKQNGKTKEISEEVEKDENKFLTQQSTTIKESVNCNDEKEKNSDAKKIDSASVVNSSSDDEKDEKSDNTKKLNLASVVDSSSDDDNKKLDSASVVNSSSDDEKGKKSHDTKKLDSASVVNSSSDDEKEKKSDNTKKLESASVVNSSSDDEREKKSDITNKLDSASVVNSSSDDEKEKISHNTKKLDSVSIRKSSSDDEKEKKSDNTKKLNAASVVNSSSDDKKEKKSDKTKKLDSVFVVNSSSGDKLGYNEANSESYLVPERDNMKDDTKPKTDVQTTESDSVLTVNKPKSTIENTSDSDSVSSVICENAIKKIHKTEALSAITESESLTVVQSDKSEFPIEDKSYESALTLEDKSTSESFPASEDNSKSVFENQLISNESCIKNVAKNTSRPADKDDNSDTTTQSVSLPCHSDDHAEATGEFIHMSSDSSDTLICSSKKRKMSSSDDESAVKRQKLNEDLNKQENNENSIESTKFSNHQTQKEVESSHSDCKLEIKSCDTNKDLTAPETKTINVDLKDVNETETVNLADKEKETIFEESSLREKTNINNADSDLTSKETEMKSTVTYFRKEAETATNAKEVEMDAKVSTNTSPKPVKSISSKSDQGVVKTIDSLNEEEKSPEKPEMNSKIVIHSLFKNVELQPAPASSTNKEASSDKKIKFRSMYHEKLDKRVSVLKTSNSLKLKEKVSQELKLRSKKVDNNNSNKESDLSDNKLNAKDDSKDKQGDDDHLKTSSDESHSKILNLKNLSTSVQTKENEPESSNSSEKDKDAQSLSMESDLNKSKISHEEAEHKNSDVSSKDKPDYLKTSKPPSKEYKTTSNEVSTQLSSKPGIFPKQIESQPEQPTKSIPSQQKIAEGAPTNSESSNSTGKSPPRKRKITDESDDVEVSSPSRFLSSNNFDPSVSEDEMELGEDAVAPFAQRKKFKAKPLQNTSQKDFFERSEEQVIQSYLEEVWQALQGISLDDLITDDIVQPLKLKHYNVGFLLALNDFRVHLGASFEDLIVWLKKLLPIELREKGFEPCLEKFSNYLFNRNKPGEDLSSKVIGQVLPLDLFLCTKKPTIVEEERVVSDCFITDIIDDISNNKNSLNITKWSDFLAPVNLDDLLIGNPSRVTWSQFNNGLLYALWRVNKMLNGNDDNFIKWLSLISTSKMKDKDYAAMAKAATAIHDHLEKYPEEINRLVAPIVVRQGTTGSKSLNSKPQKIDSSSSLKNETASKQNEYSSHSKEIDEVVIEREVYHTTSRKASVIKKVRPISSVMEGSAKKSLSPNRKTARVLPQPPTDIVIQRPSNTGDDELTIVSSSGSRSLVNTEPRSIAETVTTPRISNNLTSDGGRSIINSTETSHTASAKPLNIIHGNQFVKYFPNVSVLNPKEQVTNSSIVNTNNSLSCQSNKLPSDPQPNAIVPQSSRTLSVVNEASNPFLQNNQMNFQRFGFPYNSSVPQGVPVLPVISNGGYISVLPISMQIPSNCSGPVNAHLPGYPNIGLNFNPTNQEFNSQLPHVGFTQPVNNSGNELINKVSILEQQLQEIRKQNSQLIEMNQKLMHKTVNDNVPDADEHVPYISEQDPLSLSAGNSDEDPLDASPNTEYLHCENSSSDDSLVILPNPSYSNRGSSKRMTKRPVIKKTKPSFEEALNYNYKK